MKFSIFLLLAASQSAFGLSGVIHSKVLGSQQVNVEYTAVRVISEPITTEIKNDWDTQEQFCQSFLQFQNVAQAIYRLGDIQVQESQNLLVGQSYNEIEAGQECLAPNQLLNTNQLYLAKGGHPEFVISQKNVAGEVKRLGLRLSFPRQMATGALVQTTPGFYTIDKLAFGRQPVTVDYSVVETTILADGRPSWSFLEHGTVTLK